MEHLNIQNQIAAPNIRATLPTTDTLINWFGDPSSFIEKFSSQISTDPRITAWSIHNGHGPAVSSGPELIPPRNLELGTHMDVIPIDGTDGYSLVIMTVKNMQALGMAARISTLSPAEVTALRGFIGGYAWDDQEGGYVSQPFGWQGVNDYFAACGLNDAQVLDSYKCIRHQLKARIPSVEIRRAILPRMGAGSLASEAIYHIYLIEGIAQDLRLSTQVARGEEVTFSKGLELLRDIVSTLRIPVYINEPNPGSPKTEQAELFMHLVELVTNAYDASSKSCNITYENYAGGTLYNVVDDGNGIDPQIQEQVLLPGFSTKGEDRGLGLGYFNQFVLSRGGRLDILSPYLDGRGTCLRFFLPRNVSPGTNSVAVVL